MTPEERRILYRLARSLRLGQGGLWSDLKYQTQYGPEFAEFPYFPAAVEFESHAIRAVGALNDADKRLLAAEWKSKPRDGYELKDDERILRQYAAVVVDLLVSRARRAGARTISFS